MPQAQNKRLNKMAKTKQPVKKFQPVNYLKSPLKMANFMLVFAIFGVSYLIYTNAATAFTAGFYGSIELDQATRINSARKTAGVGTLQHIECLNKTAEAWTLSMVKNFEQTRDYKSLKHNPNGAAQVDQNCGGYWTSIGENVGYSPAENGSKAMFDAYMNSTGHRANILAGKYTKVGVGAYIDRFGMLWTTHMFATCSTCPAAWSTNATLPADPVPPLPPSKWYNWTNADNYSTKSAIPAGSGPGTSSMNSSRIDVFIRGSDGQMKQRNLSGSTWSAWSSVSGSIASTPASVSMSDGRIDAFARSDKDTLLHNVNGFGKWTGWEDLGGSIVSAPSAVSMNSGRMDIFARSASGTLVHKWFVNGAWTGWESLGGSFTDAPSAVSMKDGRIDVYARSGNGTLLHKFVLNGTWSPWEDLGGSFIGSPSAVSTSDGRMDVFARGAAGGLQQKRFAP